jgi:hypothetical protein
VDEHLVVDVLIPGRELNDPVQSEDPPIDGVLEDQTVLVSGARLVQDPSYPEAVLQRAPAAAG